MRICLYTPLLVLGLLLLPACQQAGDGARQKIAVVDMGRIMRDSLPAQAGVKFLEGLHSDMQSQINAIQDRLTKKPDDDAAQKELQTVYMSAQQRMQTEQQHVVTLLDDAIQRIINTFREQKGYDIIINAEVTASYSQAIDLTSEIIVEVNKQKIEFKAAAEAAKPPVADVPPNQNATTPAPGK